jgi:hypothetical protein
MVCRLRAAAPRPTVAPGYVFATPVLGGQAAVAVAIPFGREAAAVNANVVGILGPHTVRFCEQLIRRLSSFSRPVDNKGQRIGALRLLHLNFN